MKRIRKSLIILFFLIQQVFQMNPEASSLAQQTDIQRLPNGEPILRLPFPSGTVAFCQQGNLSPKGHSHSAKNTNCTHALDLTTLIEQQAVVSAAPGTVVKIYDKATAANESAGNGFGNHVKVDHGNGYFTFYAHLKSIIVKKGDKVLAGTKLGIMGNTGKAGNEHVHFSLHHGDPTPDGTCTTVPMHAIIASDMNFANGFTLISSLEFIGGGSQVTSKGHRYGSENSQDRGLLIGEPGSGLSACLEKADALLFKKIGKNSNLEDILDSWHDGVSARKRLERLVQQEPKNYEAWYWIAVASIRDLKEPARARQSLDKILVVSPLPKSPLWLLPWTYLRMGEVAEAEGKISEARTWFKKSQKYTDQGKEFSDLTSSALMRCRKKL